MPAQGSCRLMLMKFSAPDGVYNIHYRLQLLLKRLVGLENLKRPTEVQSIIFHYSKSLKFRRAASS